MSRSPYAKCTTLKALAVSPNIISNYATHIWFSSSIVHVVQDPYKGAHTCQGHPMQNAQH